MPPGRRNNVDVDYWTEDNTELNIQNQAVSRVVIIPNTEAPRLFQWFLSESSYYHIGL